MKDLPSNQGPVAKGTEVLDGAAGGVVMSRAIELARLSGRSAIQLAKADWEQAKTEFFAMSNGAHPLRQGKFKRLIE